MRDLIVKLSSIIISVIFFNIAINADKLYSAIIGFVLALLSAGFALFLLFENKLKRTFPMIENNIFNEPINNNPNYSRFTLGTVLFYIFGCYSMTFIFIYGALAGINPLRHFWCTNLIYYLLVALFLLASCFLTFLLIKFLAGRKKIEH